MEQFLYILLGAVLSYIATTVVEQQKNKTKKKEESSAYILRTKLQLQSVNEAIDKLQTSFQYRDFFEVLKLDLLKELIQDLKNLKAGVVNLPSQMQEKFLSLLSDISMMHADILGIENFSANEASNIGLEGATFTNSAAFDEYFKRQRMQKYIELVDLKRRLDDFLKEI